MPAPVRATRAAIRHGDSLSWLRGTFDVGSCPGDQDRRLDDEQHNDGKTRSAQDDKSLQGGPAVKINGGDVDHSMASDKLEDLTDK
jgi:hypothetical protein